MQATVQIVDEAAHMVFNADFEMETLASDCRFTEGPVWNQQGFYLFSDITANTVFKLVPGKEKEIFLTASGTDHLADEDLKPDQVGSNGLAYDNKGALLVCRHGSHMVGKWNGGELAPFITSFQNKPFNSPNDIIVDNRGRVFFSDPPYGLKEGQLNPAKFQPLAAVYCYDAGETRLVCDKYQYPNGVCITPDGKKLYICSHKPFEKFISVYDLETLQFEKILAEENSDGMKCDPHGNVYLSNREGLVILNPEGKRLAVIRLATEPANHCFGGMNKKDLLITARQNVFLLKNFLR
ncbi:MAG TPA: SMP-30/gluconolactonase/LRE family protein [Flavisolibacter sp.]|nr:SMP-30/gluconolactonase/LRE family protein [Flavisolibacter sp.]